MNDGKIKGMVKTALFTAIIFIMTYTLKIPVSITGGYTHLGDCGIILGVVLLGRKKGTIAATCGAALADFLGGFAVWVVPTLVIKGIMAFVMGTVTEILLPNKKLNWLIGACIGGILQIIGYTTVKVAMLGLEPAVLTILGISFQTVFGIIAASVIITGLTQTKSLQMLKRMGQQ